MNNIEPNYYMVETEDRPLPPLFNYPRDLPHYAIKTYAGFFLSRNFLPLQYDAIKEGKLFDAKGISEKYIGDYGDVETIVARLNEGLSPWPSEEVKKGSQRKWLGGFAAIAIGILAFLFYNR